MKRSAPLLMKLAGLKPRNRFAMAAARRQNAGAHGPCTGALRQQAKQALRRELIATRHSASP